MLFWPHLKTKNENAFEIIG